MLAYFWLLATPAVGLIFGTYLYLAVCYCGVHYDEVGNLGVGAWLGLQIEINRKGLAGSS